ncbi:MAG: deoxynucleoside kinase [Bacteroidales bacterium]|jgi:deoxyadenosine/deoxycytidine kinase|nr:deoxynucleoside kinase [Bacteroidales bacterium]
MHIAIAGNIGSGKTTLTGLLAKHYGWKAHYENADNNPYLDDFYSDMQHWSFNLQIYFLNERFGQIQEIRNSGLTVIQDRTIYEDAHIFAANLHSMGLMSMRDYSTYRSLFDKMTSFIQPLDLLIYLRASVPALVWQIQKRGRVYESGIRLDYLSKLNERYENWISRYTLGKLLVIDVDTLHFDEAPEDMRTVVNRIDALLHGLF